MNHTSVASVFHTMEAAPLHINLDRQPHLMARNNSAGTALAKTRIEQFFHTLFTGQQVNHTERRAAGHWTLRAAHRLHRYPNYVALNHLGEDAISLAAKVETSVELFVDDVREGRYLTPAGLRYDSILHLGIGGSDLGPRLLHEVFYKLGLQKNSPIRHIRFVSNVDYHELSTALGELNPATTLVVAASKSFSTRETLNNLNHIFKWLDSVGPEHRAHSVVACTCKPEKARQLGTPDQLIFEFSETVGGRYSLWGPVSLAIRLIHGNASFRQLLDGAADMDCHMLQAEFEQNIPAQMALADWTNLSVGIFSLMFSPYDSRLQLLVPYLQQLWMESLGKGVDDSGHLLPGPACPVLWGDVGTNGQHAFFQMLHQSPLNTAIEILAVAQPDHTESESHDLLLSNALAQSEAFATGKLNSPGEMADHSINYKTCRGQRPVSMVMLDRLSPYSLGYLLAMWEHRTVALAALQGINPFDQWGVELGKVIAEQIESEFKAGTFHSQNLVTQHLMHLIQQLKHTPDHA